MHYLPPPATPSAGGFVMPKVGRDPAPAGPRDLLHEPERALYRTLTKVSRALTRVCEAVGQRSRRPRKGGGRTLTQRTKGGRHRAARVTATVFAVVAFPMLAGCGEGAWAGDGGGAPAGADRRAAEKDAGGRPDRASDAGEKNAEEVREAAEARAGGERRVGDAVAGVDEKAVDAVEGAKRRAGNTSGGGPAEKVVLKIRGDARFDGSCSVGGEERRIGGEAPASYAFEPDGEEVACDVRGGGPGALGVAFEAGDDVRSVQRSGGGESKVRVVYGEDRISVEQSSSGSGGQVQSGTISDISSGDGG